MEEEGGAPNLLTPPSVPFTPPSQISSASNCTDYQSRRLNIMYSGEGGRLSHAHTVGDPPKPPGDPQNPRGGVSVPL